MECIESHGRKSLSGVYNISDLEAEGTELEVAIEAQSLGWKINERPETVEDPSILKVHLTNPPVKRIDLYFPGEMPVTAKNLKGVTIKDALDAIWMAFRKRSDEQLEEPYLTGFEWDKEECWTRLAVHLTSDPALSRG